MEIVLCAYHSVLILFSFGLCHTSELKPDFPENSASHVTLMNAS